MRPVAIALILLAAFPAAAQNRQTQALIERINRLERDLGEVQRQFYGGAAPPAAARAGDSEDRIGPTQAAQLSVRISQLENELGELTGQVETVGYSVSKIQGRLDKLVADVDFRLTAIERGLAELAKRTAPGAAASAEAGPAGAVPETGAAAPERPPAGEKVLGTITASDLAAAGTAAPTEKQPASVLPEGTPEEKYDFSIKLLRQGDFAEAERAFREFLSAHGNHELAGNAQYWLGETFYVRGEFEQAARAFLEGYQKYKANKKAPDSLLKLGMSLINLNQKKEACATFDQLTSEFTKAPSYIKRQVEAERKRADCR